MKTCDIIGGFNLTKGLFWKPRCWLFAPLPSKVVFWARQSCLDLRHETFKQKSHVLLIEHQNCRTYSNILSHIVTRAVLKLISNDIKVSRSLGVSESWNQISTFRSRSSSNISFEPLALHGHPGNFQWSLVTFSSLASVVQLKKNTQTLGLQSIYHI